MSATVSIRPEAPKDAVAIFELTQTAFSSMPYSDGTEGPIVDALRRDGDLVLSLVMEQAGILIGHIAFSPVTFPDCAGVTGWHALGPVSIAPDHQSQGLGRQLIDAGLADMHARSSHGIVLIGDPALYSRFGFTAACGLTYQGLEEKYVQALQFQGSGPMPHGEIQFAPAFSST